MKPKRTVTKRHQLKAPSDLQPQAQGFLALLVVAALWPERFEDGYIQASDVRKFTSSLASASAGAFRQALVRMRQQLQRHRPDIDIERRTVGRKVRLRLLRADALALEDWLFAGGHAGLMRSLWVDFVASRLTSPATFEQTTRLIDATVARMQLIRGYKGASLATIDEALCRTGSDRERAGLELAQAVTVLRRGQPGDWERAHTLLTDLTKRILPYCDIYDRLLHARILMELAYCHFLMQVRGKEDPDVVEDEARVCRIWLERARILEGGFSPADRARLCDVEALLIKAEAAVAEPPESDVLFATAERFLLEALSWAASVWDAHGIGDALHNLGEIQYVRHHLNLGRATEEQALSALRWYRESVRLAETLETNRDDVLPFARAAEVTGLLMAIRAASSPAAELMKLLEEAERHLAIARERGSPIEQRLVAWVDEHLTAYAERAGLTRPRRTPPGHGGGVST